jgi:hypothetical protein
MYISFKTLPKINNRPKSDNSPNLVTLLRTEIGTLLRKAVVEKLLRCSKHLEIFKSFCCCNKNWFLTKQGCQMVYFQKMGKFY